MKNEMDIPLAKPYTDHKEIEAVAQVISSGWISQGMQVIQFEKLMSKYLSVKNCIATNSCTSALHLSLNLLGVGSGDEVICPSFTCMATANAIRHTGARPIFAEIDDRTYNIDPLDISRKITSQTKAIMVVHQIGLSSDMNAINKIAHEYDLKIVEDAATALGAEYNGKLVGSLGSPTCFSFHPRKVITCGEGGMITTDDDDFAEKARILRSHGASVSDLIRHQVRGTVYASYGVVGFNYRLTDIQAAVGIEQMKKLRYILKRRREIAKLYDDRLSTIDEIDIPFVPKNSVHSYQSYLIRFKKGCKKNRDILLREMAERGISCRHGIAPLHLEPYYKDLYREMHLLLTEEVSSTTLFLPIFPTMSEEEIIYIVHTLKDLLVHSE